MSVLKRALLYLIRKRARSILLFLILFLMGLFMLAGLSIRFSAGRAAEDMQKSISTGLEIKMFEVPGEEIYAVDYNEQGELVRTLKHPLITESVAEELASIPGVSGYYSEMGSETLYTGLNVVPGLYTKSLKEIEEREEPVNSEVAASDRAWSRSNNFHVVQESEYYPYFAKGAFELIAGRHIHIDDTGKILISEELAARNGLTIGDFIDGQNFDFITGRFYGETYHAEIVGIFRINFEQQLSDWTAEPDILVNTVFGPFELRHWGQRQYNSFYGGDLLAEEEDRLLGSITFFVEDPAELDEIEAQMKSNEHVDWSYYTIRRYDADYKAAAKPLLSMMLFSTCMVVVMIGGALLILSLVLGMWMRSRKQEINIFTFLGMDRRTILAQFLTEIIIVAAAAFFMSCLFAMPVTRVIGDALTEFTNPSEETESFSTSYEAATGITYINRTPVKQDALSYQMSYGAAAGTFLAMVFVSFGTVILAFRRMQGFALLSRKGSDIHHWNFRRICNNGVMKAHDRAFLYITRKTGKSVLLLLTLFVIMGLFLFGVSIHSASEHAASQLRESLGGYFKITPDYRKNEVVNQIDQQLINHIAELDEIEAANAMDICYLDAQDFSLISGKFSAQGDEKAGMTKILGNTDSSLHEYFSLGIFELVEGVHIGDSDVGKALISSELAKRNQLRVGDHFVIGTSKEDIRNGAVEKTYELEIAGLFSEVQQTSHTTSQTPECDMPSNFIFTDISTTQQIMRDMRPEREQVYSGGAVFPVRDPEKLEEVIQTIEAAGMIDRDLTLLTVNNAAYQSSMEPLGRLRNISLMMLVVITVVSIILLTLILSLWERDRIHETGILVSFGISKRNIWWQRFVECASVFTVSFIVSAAALLPVTAQMGDLLYRQTSERMEQQAESEEQGNIMTGETVSADLIESEITFCMELSPAVIALSGFAGIVLIGVSVSAAFWSIVRRKPKELFVMME